MKIDGIPLDHCWRVVQRRNGKWRTWLRAVGNVFPGNNPTFPQTAEQEARAILKTVSGHWPDKEWAIINPPARVYRVKRPTPPETQFVIKGASPWPFDRRRTIGPWSERKNADVYGTMPGWLRRLLGRK
jgi:hypothetical protein